jgi:hypothetical protein
VRWSSFGSFDRAAAGDGLRPEQALRFGFVWHISASETRREGPRDTS